MTSAAGLWVGTCTRRGGRANEWRWESLLTLVLGDGRNVGSADIAIIGLAARLPGARNPAEFWINLRDGVESVREFSDDELLAAGVPRHSLLDPAYVRAGTTLDGLAEFDAEFFGFSPKEAAIMDPQHRQLLEAAWEALEDAGHVPEKFDGAIGVFAGCGMNSYFMFNLLTNHELVDDVGLFLLRHTGNDKDFLSTRVSYLLDLHGPSINVQTACSTSLVATHLAVQNLLSGECDLALVGGVTIEIPHGRGYQYQEGEVLSPDGHCRAFDHRSGGTVFGSGVGVAVLRRLDDAVGDGDQIYAVIKGTAVNNDGGRKVGYLAPSVDGQAACIAEAIAVAEIDPETIGYVECHGTGTQMGDPIEVAALTQAFRAGTERTGYCPIGSVKTNIGHLDTAAGIASLIKVSLSLRNGEIPPSLNFEQANPNIDLDRSPFFVNDELRTWPRDGSAPRRAGINSLGVGGTNAFAILEEAPALDTAPSGQGWRLIPISGKNRAALDRNTANLQAFLRDHPEVDLGDVSWTLLKGRRHFAERRVLVARDVQEAQKLLDSADPRRVFTQSLGATDRSVTFMFPGGGTQYPRMAVDLYRTQPVFAQHLDRGLELLESVHGLELIPLLFCDEADEGPATSALQNPGNQLPAVFLVEYALAQLLIAKGLEPASLVGHSVGENTAACVSGTMTFEECLGLVVLRGRLMDRVRGGAVSVALSPEEIRPIIEELELDLAVVNAPDLCVVSGPVDSIELFETRLRSDGVEPRRVAVNTAPHSRLLDPILAEFREYVSSISLSTPRIAWVSNTTGTWITNEQATDPEYWVEHLRRTVDFSACIATLTAESDSLLVEVGPGKTLSSLARMSPTFRPIHGAIPTMRHAEEVVDDEAFLLGALGRIWACGIPLQEAHWFPDGPHRRISLPTYAFDRQRYFIEPGRSREDRDDQREILEREENEADWFWEPVWRMRDRDEFAVEPCAWLVFVDQNGIGDAVVDRLRGLGHDVVTVRLGDSYQRLADDEYVIAPENGRSGYDALFKDLVRTGRIPDRIAHLALLACDDRQFRPGSSFFHRNQELGFQSLLFVGQAWAAEGIRRPLHISVATIGSQRATEHDSAPWYEQATILGPAMVIPREFPGVTVSTFDVELDTSMRQGRIGRPISSIRDRLRNTTSRVATQRASKLGLREASDSIEGHLDEIVAELCATASNDAVALRSGLRFVKDVRRVSMERAVSPRVRSGGVTLITGGLGGLGLTVAEEMHKSFGARLALLSRTGLPDRQTWDDVVRRLGAEHIVAERISRVRALEALGAEVMLVEGDVTDVEQMERVTTAVRKRFGEINAVIHAAGAVNDELIAVKIESDIEEVLAPKVYGTLVLENAVSSDQIDLFAVFSSTSTWTAPIGQVDYVAANAFLNSFAESRWARGDRAVVALNWGVWSDVGMAASSVETIDRSAALVEDCPQRLLFDRKSTDRRGRTTLTSTWTSNGKWFLDDHRNGEGDALFPGAGYLELARAALAEIGIDRPFEIRDLTFLRPLAVADGGELTVSTTLAPTLEGYEMVVREEVAVGMRSGEAGAIGRPGWRPTAQATLLLYEPEPVPDLDVDGVVAQCGVRDGARGHQAEHLSFGPRWDVLDSIRIGEGIAVAHLSLRSEFADDVHSVRLHPALVDIGTGFAMELIENYTGEHLWVPINYESVKIHSALGSEVIAIARIQPGSTERGGFATFDISLCDVAGRVAVTVRGFTIKRLDGGLDVGLGRPVLSSEVEFDEVESTDRQLSRSEIAFRHNLSLGIKPEEGMRSFGLALAADRRPVLYVTPLDLTELRGQAESTAKAQGASAGAEGAVMFGRPELESQYVEPRNDIEESLVQMWQELLGIDQVGVRDNFFELGGHSLIAVRMFARVKKSFSVEFPISVLFEAPTIEACAELISQAMPATEDSNAMSSVVPTRPRFTHLVAMHAGEGGSKSPFFLVAGMFGNVLNLRHLAHLVGTDRPFYGVQARGLFGGDDPHEDFVEMARDYLQEVRSVQPRGPYFLGGFSGGGIAAFEMAQQLRADGEEVGLLVFLDTVTAFNSPLRPIERAQIQLDNLRDRGPGYIKKWAVNRVMWEREKRRRLSDEFAVAPDGALHSTAIEAAFYRALGRYDTEYYDGVITLYRPALSPLHVFGPDRQINIDRRFIFHDNGWGPFCRQIVVTEVPGDHTGMVLEPNVRVLAGHMRSALEEAES